MSYQGNDNTGIQNKTKAEHTGGDVLGCHTSRAFQTCVNMAGSLLRLCCRPPDLTRAQVGQLIKMSVRNLRKVPPARLCFMQRACRKEVKGRELGPDHGFKSPLCELPAGDLASLCPCPHCQMGTVIVPTS